MPFNRWYLIVSLAILALMLCLAVEARAQYGAAWHGPAYRSVQFVPTWQPAPVVVYQPQPAYYYAPHREWYEYPRVEQGLFSRGVKRVMRWGIWR